MKNSLNKIISEETKQELINDVISFFYDERGEEIGVIAAEAFLDFFLDTLGKKAYTKGVYDAKKLLKERFEDINIDLDLLSEE